MKKKAKQAASRPDGARRQPKGREHTGVNDAPASPSKYATAKRFDPEAYKKLKEERRSHAEAGGESPPSSHRRDVGPGLDMRDVPPPDTPPEEWTGAPRRTTQQKAEDQLALERIAATPEGTPTKVEVVAGVCSGCLEKIIDVRSHPYWCPFWDTEEGKKVSPF